MTVRTILKYLLESRFLFSRFKIVLLFYDWKFGAGNYSFLSWSNTYNQSLAIKNLTLSKSTTIDDNYVGTYVCRYIFTKTEASNKGEHNNNNQKVKQWTTFEDAYFESRSLLD